MSRVKTNLTDEPFVQRWSRRKKQTERAEPEQTPKTIGSDQASAEPSELESATKSFEQLTDADMPALDSLDEHSDYRPFFAPNVSAELRRLALRKLFHQPVFNIRDGLCEYDDDYTQFEPLGNIVTADMKFMQELAERRERERAEALAQADGSESNRVSEAETDTVSEASTPDQQTTLGEQTDEQPTNPQQDTAKV